MERHPDDRPVRRRSWIQVRSADGFKVTIDEPSETLVQAVLEMIGRHTHEAYDERMQEDAEKEG